MSLVANAEDPATEYDTLAKLFHWGIVALLAAQYAVGWIMPHISAGTPNESWVSWHLSLGVAVLFFMILRLLRRLSRPVALPAAVPPWQNRLAHATHLILYFLAIINPLLGWAAASYRGWNVVLFGVIPLPAMAAKGTPWAHTAGDVHIVLIYVLLGAIALHVAGALYHHFFMRDGVLLRMLPGGAGAPAHAADPKRQSL